MDATASNNLPALVVSICLNYIDRGSVSVASKGLADELHLGPNDLGKLFSAFFWTYALMQIPVGWLIDKVHKGRPPAALSSVRVAPVVTKHRKGVSVALRF